MKKIITSILGIATALSLVACSSQSATTSTTAAQVAATTEATTAAKTLTKISIAASPTPHAEILEAAKKTMEDKGYELDIIEFEDYVQPNIVVDDGQVLANYFQHTPYLDDFNAEKGTHVVSVGKIHYEPFGIYKGTKNSLDDVAEGDKVAVPNDVTNEARALLLLQDAGLIKLKEGVGLTATKLDIVENPKNIEVVELEAAQTPRSLDSVAFACMNGNYALQAGYQVSDALYVEKSDSEAAQTYANVLCVKEGNENNEGIKTLLSVLKSKEITDFINNKYNQAVIPIN